MRRCGEKWTISVTVSHAMKDALEMTALMWNAYKIRGQAGKSILALGRFRMQRYVKVMVIGGGISGMKAAEVLPSGDMRCLSMRRATN